jgi:acyl-CoA synthetase (AMP-forming)/AMP-acid ligase II/acyl carrier protein
MSNARTIPELLTSQATTRPDAVALGDLSRPGLRYEQLDDVTRRCARFLLGLGLQRDDRVAISLPNGPEMATAFLSVSRIAIAAPLNPGLTRSEFAYYLADLDARALVVAEHDMTDASAAAGDLGIPLITLREGQGPAGGFSFATPAERPVSEPGHESAEIAEPMDVALVLHTSGTTAKPKIVPLTHENLCSSAANVAQSLQLQPDDRCMNVMPLFHIHGLVAALLASLSAGSTVVCTPGFQAPSFFDWFGQVMPTWYTAVPTMHQAIVGRARDHERSMVRASGLRLVRSSSASLPPSVLRDMEAAFGVPVIEAYGMTEAAHQMASNALPPAPRKSGSVGPAAGPEVAIADDSGRFLPPDTVGEVVVRGTNVTAGYDGADDRSTHFFDDGWLRTGDLGFLDSDGYLFLTGRKKEIINRGGETIAPRVVDEALLEHPSVVQAVAFSVPDPELGEEVGAAVILAPGADETEASLQGFLLERLSWGRMPKRILIVEEIPKGPTGKLQRIGMAERLGLDSVRKPVEETTPDDGPDVGAASDDTVERVTALWHDVLRDPSVGPDDAFLNVGGDSITATLLVIRVEQEFSLELPLMIFFEATTIRKQSTLIDRLLADLPNETATAP